MAATRTSTSTRRRSLGGGDASRPYRSTRHGPASDRARPRAGVSACKTRYHALQVGVNRPFTKGLLLKGAYTLSKSKNMADDDGWVGLTFNTPSQFDRNYAQAGYDRRHNFQMGFVYQLPLAERQRRQRGILKADRRRLAVERRLRRVQRPPVHGHRQRRRLSTRREPQTADQRERSSRTSARLVAAAPTTIPPLGRSRRACASATRVATSSAVRAE